jgi:hypothetical protein
MKESDVRRIGEENRRLADAPPAAGRDGVADALDSAKRKTDDEWLAFATEDPAFFIKPSDAV